MADIYKVLDLYGMKTSVSEYGDGHINDTYVFDYDDQKYILQRINHEIFKNPGDVMNNILYITEHISKKLINRGINPDRKTLTVVLTIDNKPFCEVDGLYYRIYKFVDNTITYQTVEKPELFYSAAKGFGEFFQ